MGWKLEKLGIFFRQDIYLDSAYAVIQEKRNLG